MTSIQQQKWNIKNTHGELTANNCYTATQLNAQLKQRAFLVSHQSESAVLSMVASLKTIPLLPHITELNLTSEPISPQ